MPGKRTRALGPSEILNHTKLLLVLDALLREGSVTAAAASFGIQASAVSRMLGKLRDHYQDPIFTRTGKGLRPTEFAESLRFKLRALAHDAETLFDPRTARTEPFRDTPEAGARPRSPPPMTPAPANPLDAAPSSIEVARRLAAIDKTAPPGRRLAKYIAYAASGPGRSRTLTADEARDALGVILQGGADPLQIGALLTVMQCRGVTAMELAGFARAIQDSIAVRLPARLTPDLDWPAYLSPRWRGSPWFIHSLKLVAMSGARIVLHGHAPHDSGNRKIEAAARNADIPVCVTGKQLADALERVSIAYAPLETLSPGANTLLSAYPLFETRSPVNNAVQLINPFGAKTTITGVAENTSRDLYRRAARLMGRTSFAAVGGTRDFAQISTSRANPVFALAGGSDREWTVPAHAAPRSGTPKGFSQHEYWQAVWSGAARDEHAQYVILQTAAVALRVLAGETEAGAEPFFLQAAALWARRLR